MQSFTKKKLALAVGAALTFAAMNAQAAAPINRATNPVVISTISGVTDTTIRSLLSTTGLSGSTVTLSVNLTSAVTTAGIAGDIQAVAPGAPTVLITALTVNNATLANNNVNVYTGTLSATTQLAVTSATFVPDGTSITGNASVNVVLTAVTAPKAYRINAGNLEYTSDNGTTGNTAVAFAPVNIDVQSALATGALIYTEVDAVAGYLLSGADAVIAPTQTVNGTIKNSLAPTPTIKTASAAGGALINGFVIDTGTPITLAAANLAVTTAGGLNTPTGATLNGAGTTFPAASMGAPVCASSKCTVTFAGLGAVATSVDYVSPVGTPDAADAAFYTALNFNTGVDDAVAAYNVPFRVDGVNASKASYTEVFNVSDGGVSKLANNGGLAAGDAAAFPAVGSTITDGASPTVTKAEFASNDIAMTNTLKLTFSEQMALIGFDDLREIAENVFIGSDSLAATNLNNDGNLTKSLSNPVGTGLGELTLTLDTTASSVNGTSTPNLFSGKTVTVTTGIALKETNDNGYSATTPALDSVSLADVSKAATTSDSDYTVAATYAYNAAAELAGGVKSASGAVEGASATALATTPLAVNISFDGHGLSGDTTATSQTSSTDATKVSTIKVKFDAGMEVGFASGKTKADLVGHIRVDVTDADWVAPPGIPTDNPQNWQFFPTAAQMDLDTAGSVLTITIPTELVYQQVSSPTGMNVRYLAAGETAKVLIKKGATDLTDANNVVDAGNVSVLMPLFASNLTDTLYTQNIRGAVSDAPNGSLMHAYIAKWFDKQVDGKIGSADVKITSARITIKDDKLAADVALDTSANGTTPAATAAAAAGGATAADVAALVVNAFPGSGAANAAVAAANAAGATRASVITAMSGFTKNVLEYAIMTQLSKDKPEPITAWIHVHRSNDAVATATGDSGGPASGTSGVADQRFIDIRAALFPYNPGNTPDKILYEVTIDPVKGTINSPRIVGQLKMTSKSAPKLTRGLQFLDADGNLALAANSADATLRGTSNYAIEAQGLVGAGGAFNMIVGTDAKTTAQLDNMKDSFLLLVLENPQADTANGENEFTLLTSADKDANNFVPFAPNLISLKGEVTNLSTQPVAPATTPLPPVESLAKIHSTPGLEVTSKWQLLGFRSLDRKAPLGSANLPRFMVGLDNGLGFPVSIWSGDIADYGVTALGWPAFLSATPGDMAFSMLGNKTGVMSQGANGDTVGALNVKPNAVAFAFSDDDAAAANTLPGGDRQLFAKVLADDVPTGFPVGWSLVSVPTDWVTTLPAEIGMIIDVGSQAKTQYTWSLAEGDTAPTLKAGQPVFVFVNTAITGK